MGYIRTIMGVAGVVIWAGVSSTGTLAAGDPVKGKSAFGICKACHSLEEGKKTIGPSLFKVVGRQAGIVEKYKYSPDYVTAGEKGLKWTEENISNYLKNPKKFLAAYLEKKKVKSRMATKIRQADKRNNIAAYLASIFKE